MFALDFATQAQQMKALCGQPDYALGSVHAITRDGTLVIASASGSQLSTPRWTRSSTALPWRSRSNAARSSPSWTAYPAQVAATGRHRALATDPVLRSLTWRISGLR
jgi:hypothetical protein